MDREQKEIYDSLVYYLVYKLGGSIEIDIEELETFYKECGTRINYDFEADKLIIESTRLEN